MKKFLSILFVLVLALGLVACKKDDPTPTPDPTPVTPDPVVVVDTQVPAALQEVCQSATKIYLTCSGQADQSIVKNVIKKAGQQLGLTFTFGKDATSDVYEDNLLNADSVEDGSVVLLVVGGSNKGLGAAKTDVASEAARATAFANKAEAGKITLVVIHIGGTARRGDTSDPIIKAAAPSADLLLVVAEGNGDGYFTNVSSEHDIPLFLYSKTSKMKASFVKLFE